MLVNRVQAEFIGTNRIDPDYYRPEHLADEKRLRHFGSDELNTVGHFFAGPFGSKLPSDLYLSTGIPLFRVGNVGSMEVLLNGMAHLAPKVHEELIDSEVIPGDLLIVKASVGEKICRVPHWMPRANITQHIIGIRPNGSVDMDYVAAFLFCQYGRRQLVRRSLGSIIQYLGITDSRSVLLPKICSKAQEYIGEKQRCAERLRGASERLEIKIEGKFEFLTHKSPEPKKAWWANHNSIDPYRINAPHYDAAVLSMLENARSGTGLASLRSLIGPRGLGGGATPLGADYPPDGVFFVRVQNVKPYRLDLSDAAYIDSATDEELKRSRCAEGDVILSITGYPGTASIVLAEDLPVNINQHSVRFDIVGDLSPEFVTAALNSPFLKRQVDRLAIGGTREALDFTSVGNLQIPVLRESDRDEITAWVTTSNKCVREATRLTTASKFFVEALIDGKVTEAELVAAQQALDRGEHSADRALLSRMTRKGLDVPGEPPLFPDLDTLYALLDETQIDETK